MPAEAKAAQAASGEAATGGGTVKYHDMWQSRDDVVHDYGANTPSEGEIVYAGYTDRDYEGDALVVFVRDGVWFENNDGHCSCYGLESWSPEVTSPDALLIRQGWPGLHDAIRAHKARKFLKLDLAQTEG